MIDVYAGLSSVMGGASLASQSQWEEQTFSFLCFSSAAAVTSLSSPRTVLQYGSTTMKTRTRDAPVSTGSPGP